MVFGRAWLRFLLQAGFLVGAASVAAATHLGAIAIAGVMAVAFGLVAASEWVITRTAGRPTIRARIRPRDGSAPVTTPAPAATPKPGSSLLRPPGGRLAEEHGEQVPAASPPAPTPPPAPPPVRARPAPPKPTRRPAPAAAAPAARPPARARPSQERRPPRPVEPGPAPPAPPPPAPAVQPPPPAPPVVAPALPERRAWNVFELQNRARARAGADIARDEELSFLLLYLREFADTSGNLPEDFDSFVRESFPELLAT